MIAALLIAVSYSAKFFGDPQYWGRIGELDNSINIVDTQTKVYQASGGDLSDYKKEPLKSVINEEKLLLDEKITLEYIKYNEYMKDCIELNNLYLTGKPPETKQLHPQKADLIAQNQKYSYFLKEGITPVSEKYTNNSAFFSLRLLSGLPFFVLILLVVAIASDCFTREKEKETSKLLFTQPLKTSSVVIAKFLSLWVYCTAAAAVVSVVALLASGFVFGFGDLRYLIFVDTNSFTSIFNFKSGPNFEQVAIYKLLPLLIAAQLFVIPMVISVSMLFSSFVKSSSISAFCCTALFFVSNGLDYFIPNLGKITKYIPFASANIRAAMQIDCITSSPSLLNNYYLCLIMLLLVTAVFVFLTALLMKRKKSY